MPEKLVSIMMNTYNGEKYIKEAIDSVITQTYKNWELIIWDNISTDNTAKIVNSYDDIRIKYYLAEEHTNLGKARSLAITKCKGQFIAFLDSDDIWIKNKLEIQIPFFSDQKIGLVASNSQFFKNNKNLKTLYNDNIPRDGFIFDQLLENYYLGIETITIRSSILDQLDHTFDENLHSISDFDFFIRIAEKSKVKILKYITAKWRIHENNETFSFPKKFIDEGIIWKNKIEENYQHICIKYKNSWKIYVQNLNINHAEYLLINNYKKDSLSKLKDIKYFNKKATIIFICSWLPHGGQIYKILKNIRKNI